MKVARGDVILVNYPFASGTSGKLRPAVVVQVNCNNRRLNSTILAPITTNLSHSHEATQVLIDITTPDGQQTGLLRPSVVNAKT